ncbi:ParB/RepB/Spo0J family partition protein [Rothia sp. P6271]|uniref:ParB/RepB/Spo0J family partition protein n=1 Tax=unclassified Rothia (in: high G+C Gram-positive bacteria) TaxID=2689056 RepID=UPI003AC2E27B
MAEKKRGLGRGIGALIPTENYTEKNVHISQTADRLSQNAPQHNGDSKNVSRGTSQTQQKDSKKKRADMGAALRGSTSNRRPVDFFFGGESQSDSGLIPVPGAQFTILNVHDIHPNRKQPRTEFNEQDMEELVHSVKEIGVLQPIVVRKSRENGQEKYELVMGERRWRATQRAGLDTIPAIVRETHDVDLLRDALLENLHRSQLNPIEEAAAYQQLLEEFGTTQEQLAQKIGRSRSLIANTIRLLKLPALVQRRVAVGVLSSGHARALLSLKTHAEMEKVAQKIVNEGLSVRAVEELVSHFSEQPKKEPKTIRPQKHHERLDYIADAFADRLDTNVKIQLGARKGKMTIEFASVEDLNRIISVLDPNIDKK